VLDLVPLARTRWEVADADRDVELKPTLTRQPDRSRPGGFDLDLWIRTPGSGRVARIFGEAGHTTTARVYGGRWWPPVIEDVHRHRMLAGLRRAAAVVVQETTEAFSTSDRRSRIGVLVGRPGDHREQPVLILLSCFPEASSVSAEIPVRFIYAPPSRTDDQGREGPRSASASASWFTAGPMRPGGTATNPSKEDRRREPAFVGVGGQGCDDEIAASL
jgi:hypothetical protein